MENENSTQLYSEGEINSNGYIPRREVGVEVLKRNESTVRA